MKRWTTQFQDAQFYMVFVCGMTMKVAESLIHNTVNLELVELWAALGAASSDDGFEALNRWQKSPKTCRALLAL